MEFLRVSIARQNTTGRWREYKISKNKKRRRKYEKESKKSIFMYNGMHDGNKPCNIFLTNHNGEHLDHSSTKTENCAIMFA